VYYVGLFSPYFSLLQLHFTSGQIVRSSGRPRLRPDVVPDKISTIVCQCKPWNVTLAIQDHLYCKQANVNCKLHGHLVIPTGPSEVQQVFDETCMLMKELDHLKKAVQAKEQQVKNKENSQHKGNKKHFTVEAIRTGLQLSMACGPSGYRKVL